MESMFISTAAPRDHASRPWNAAAFLLSGAANRLATRTGDTVAVALAYPVIAPVAGNPCVVTKQDRPPRGVPR